MKYKSSKLPLLALLALSQAAVAQQTIQNDTGTASREVRNSDELLVQATQRLAKHPSLQATMQHRVRMFGQQLVGTGTYRQLQTDQQLFLSLDIQLQVGSQLARSRQIRNGQYLWTCREVAGTKTVGKVDLQQVRAALAESDKTPLPDPSTNWMLLGGLPNLLGQIQTNFQFQPATLGDLGQRGVWILAGTWRLEKVSAWLPRASAKSSKLATEAMTSKNLPEHLPDTVVIFLGAEDLIPYRIEYLRHREPVAIPATSVDLDGTTPLVTLDVVEFRPSATLTPADFAFEADAAAGVDVTELYLRNLGLRN